MRARTNASTTHNAYRNIYFAQSSKAAATQIHSITIRFTSIRAIISNFIKFICMREFLLLVCSFRHKFPINCIFFPLFLRYSFIFCFRFVHFRRLCSFVPATAATAAPMLLLGYVYFITVLLFCSFFSYIILVVIDIFDNFICCCCCRC